MYEKIYASIKINTDFLSQNMKGRMQHMDRKDFFWFKIKYLIQLNLDIYLTLNVEA